MFVLNDDSGNLSDQKTTMHNASLYYSVPSRFPKPLESRSIIK
jgi:hypothetical protein